MSFLQKVAGCLLVLACLVACQPVPDYECEWSSGKEDDRSSGKENEPLCKWSSESDMSSDCEIWNPELPANVAWSTTESANSSCTDIVAEPVFKKTFKDYISSEVSSGQKLKRKALTYLSMKMSLKTLCLCGRKCINSWTINMIRQVREQFWLNTKPSRMALLKSHFETSEKHGKFRYFNVKVGKQVHHVCSKAFQNVFRINKNTLTRVAELFYEESVSTIGKSPRDWNKNTLILITWLENYFNFYGERMPHKKDIVLPYGTFIQDIYHTYKDEMRNPVSRSQFYKTWSDNFAHVKAKKTNSFTKCTTCVMLERQMAKTFNAELRAEYRKQKEAHNIRQMLERKYYYSKRESAISNPSKFMSVIIDGMDQGKTNLPHFTGRKPKNLNPADLLKTHITGVLNHGHGGFRGYIDFGEYPHDPNLVINILLKELIHTAKENNNRLPGILYLQADNCWRENKNRYVLSFLELLVREQVFNEIHLSFLPVGHTHEDIDAHFSKISQKLYCTDCETLPDLLKLLKKAEMVGAMANYKEWMEKKINPLKHISEPLHYKFVKSDSNVHVFYKGRHNHSWKQLTSNILETSPDQKPCPLLPDFTNIDIIRKEKQIQTVTYLFQNEDSTVFWKKFYATLNSYSLDIGIPFLDQLPRQAHHTAAFEGIGFVPEVREQLEKETREPEVLVTKRKVTEVSRDKPPSKKSKGPKSVSTAYKKRVLNMREKTGNRKKSKGRKYIVLEKTYILHLTGEEKKHIWMIILLNVYMCINFVIAMFLQIMRIAIEYCLLYIIFEILHREMKKVLMIHMAAFKACQSACPAVSFFVRGKTNKLLDISVFRNFNSFAL